MKKLFYGLFFILAAVLIVMSQMGYFENTNIPKLLLSILLGACLLKSLLNRSIWGTIFSSSILVILYKSLIGITEVSNFSIILAALLISIGLSIIFGKHNITWNMKCQKNSSKFSKNSNTDDEVEVNVSFGSNIEYISSSNFKKAILNSNFGELNVYFDNAEIKEDTAEIELNVSFSGVQLYIPKNWKIVNKARVSLAGIDEKGRPGETDKIVTITGNVNLAGVEIIYI